MGQQVAIVEARAVVASLISRFRVAPADSTRNRDGWFRDNEVIRVSWGGIAVTGIGGCLATGMAGSMTPMSSGCAWAEQHCSADAWWNSSC